MEYKILDAYRYDGMDRFIGAVGGAGLVALVFGPMFDNSALTIAGGAGVVSSVLAEGISYVKAYMEATLDYKANNSFTKISE